MKGFWLFKILYFILLGDKDLRPSTLNAGEGAEVPFVWDQALGHHGLAPAIFEVRLSELLSFGTKVRVSEPKQWL